MNKAAKRLFSALLMTAMIFLPESVIAATGKPMMKVMKEIDEAWMKSSPMVDYDDAELRMWVEAYVASLGATAKAEIARVLYDLTTEHAAYNDSLFKEQLSYRGRKVGIYDIPEIDRGYFIEQKPYSTCLKEIIAHIEQGGPQPLWLCGDFARFYVGLLRTMGFAAYVRVVGFRNLAKDEFLDGTHVQVVTLFPDTNVAYYSDPSLGVIGGKNYRLAYYQMNETFYSTGGIDLVSNRSRCETVVLEEVMKEMPPNRRPDNRPDWETAPFLN